MTQPTINAVCLPQHDLDACRALGSMQSAGLVSVDAPTRRDRKDYHLAWQRANRDHVNRQNKEWRSANRATCNRMLRDWRQKQREIGKPLTSPESRARRRKRSAEILAGLRVQVHTLLGGKCKHCGFDDSRALQVDHVHGGNCRERRAGIRQGYRAILKDIPNGKYQLLCANCNWIKRHTNNEAPKYNGG